jgi:hypothetical protein
VQIRLGGTNTAATERSYASVKAGQDGAIRVRFMMPAWWPDGEAITTPEVVVVASTADFVYKGSAVFTYDGNSPPKTTIPSQEGASGTSMWLPPALTGSVTWKP